MARDPGFLQRNNIEVVGTSGIDGEGDDASAIDWSDPAVTAGLRFRQRPGPDNALGLVKFIFPNHFSIYLHDTPSDRLFNRAARTFSHGCIRIEDPVRLAAWVLRDQPQWTGPHHSSHARAIRTGRHVEGKAAGPHRHWTAWVDPDGSVTFVDDPYGIDRAHARLRGYAGIS